VPCGGPTQQPEPRSKRYGPKWQRTAFLGVFFFSGRTRPIIYTSGWSGQFRCQKSAPADLRSCRDFSGHHHGPDKKQRWWWWRVCASSSHNQREQRAIRQALTSTSLWCIRPGGLDPPPAPCMSAWALACHMSSLTARTFKCCVGVFGHVSCWCMCTHMLGHLSRPHGVSLASVRAFVGAWAVRVAFVRVGDLRRLGVCACVCLRDAFVSAFARVVGGVLACVSVRLCVGAVVRA